MQSTTFLQSNHAKIIWRNIAVVVFAVAFALLGLCVTIIPTHAADNRGYTVGEIYGQHANVQHLYDLITGKENATYADVVAAAKTVTNSATMREYNDGNNIKVTFGGREWYAVYLSETNEANPRPILTLWLAEAFTTAKWNNKTAGEGTSYNVYPADMYGTSYVRTQILNNAGGYSTDYGKTLNNTVTPDANHELAKYSVPSVSGTLTDVIVKPAAVEWQRAGQIAIMYDNTANRKNENWGEEPEDGWMTNLWGTESDSYSNNYSAIPSYGAWQNDYLWLPSITEHYHLWEMYAGEATNGKGLIDYYNQGVYWTRSGTRNYHAYSGVHANNPDNNFVYTEREIRPALHLDLSATALLADWKEEPTDVTVAYNATEQTIEKIKPSWYDNAMTITYRNEKGDPVTEVNDAGVYTATVKLNDMTKDITLTVTPQAVTVSGITASDKTYDRTQSVTFDISSVEFTGRYNIDQLSVICTGKFADKNVGVGKPVTATVTLTGTAAHNYVLTNHELTLTAEIRAKTVVVNGITVNSKEYDNTDRANLTTGGVNLLVGGMCQGDDLTVAVTGTYAQVAVGSDIPVTLDIKLVGDDAGNYKIDESSQKEAKGNITERLITVTINDQTVKVGDPSNLTARVTSGSLASGDTANAVYALLIDLPTAPDAENVIDPDNLPVGEYTITGKPADNEIATNYDITFVDGKYTVLTAEAWDALQTKDDEPKDSNAWLIIIIVMAVAAFIGALVGIGLVVRSHDKNREPKPAKVKPSKPAKKAKKQEQQSAPVVDGKKA